MRIATLLACSLLTLTGCAIDGKPKAHLSNPERVTDMKFIISPDNLANKASVELRGQMAEEISRNLSSWGYPVTALKSQEEVFSHTLEGKVGRPEKKSTPPGLSLDFGNSDPRALDFQKAEVVPVACVLRARNKSEDPVKLAGEFSLPADFDEVMGTPKKTVPPGFYVDRIATVCLNLLSELNIPKTTPLVAATSWKPAVDIEIRDKPPAKSEAAPLIDTPHPSLPPVGKGVNSTALPAATPGSLPAKPAAPEGVTPVAPPAGTSEHAPAATEAAPTMEEKRKQLIIRNLGTPVILEFGYERL